MGFDIPNHDSKESKKNFYASHIFHERQMNSCPIGCEGCAVSATTSAQGSMSYTELLGFYEEARDLGVSLKLTKVEGYDPVFVNYEDNSEIPFAQSVAAAVDMGHTITTPICTTGSWKSPRTKWQLEELGKLSNHYRKYTYPSGNQGESFVLSVPREIRPYANGKYDFEEHIKKVVEDICLLTQNGNLEVLIYHNSTVDGDMEFATEIRDRVFALLNEDQRKKAKLIVSDFNSEIIPESCMRYANSILLTNNGCYPLDQVTVEWDMNSRLLSDNSVQEVQRV